jgi:integrase
MHGRPPRISGHREIKLPISVTVAIDFEYNALEPRRLREVELPFLHGGRHHVARLFSRRVHRRRERLEKSYSQVIEEEAREQRGKTIQQASDEFLLEYKVKHESPTFAVYALGHVTDHLGKKLVVEITPAAVQGYQTSRLAEKAGPKTINNEVLLLLRLCGDQGDPIRARLRREKAMKLAAPPSPGRAYTADEKARMVAEAAKLRSKNMYPALVVDLNCGLRDKELRELRWRQIDLVHKKALTVGKSKTEAGTGRVIPLNDTVLAALQTHAAWYIRRFGECKPEWYVPKAVQRQKAHLLAAS